MLELGGNAACIVDDGVDLEDVTDRLMFGAFYQSGQSCIGVQRILVHANVYDELKTMLVAKTKALISGDPCKGDTFIGPMISTGEAERLDTWIQEAMRAWDRLDVGGVVIGDVPSWRVDNMPYGGVKDSGLGREGVKFAMEDMTEIRNLVIRTRQ